ncbi:hypothetical protein ACFQ8C_30425 [Streptomyces sp. NPDC056503]|uniref:hypothetical protein n=1 Tax=Streptomyces sp. NPDC056503 TaxID=3345842 RepID=UPI003681384B
MDDAYADISPCADSRGLRLTVPAPASRGREEATGMRIPTTDTRCVNLLIGRHPATTCLPYALDGALTTLRPGSPEEVTVHVAVGPTCSTVVSKLGYRIPDGQTLHTGGMQPRPERTCV